jgi:hypothetical protein
MTNVSEESTASIFRIEEEAKQETRKKEAASRALKMEAVRSSEKSVNFH